MDDEGQGPWLAADRMPDDPIARIDIYLPSKFTSVRRGRWEDTFAQFLEPWHIWRYTWVASKSLLDKASKKRRELGVKALESNGFYMIPKEGE